MLALCGDRGAAGRADMHELQTVLWCVGLFSMHEVSVHEVHADLTQVCLAAEIRL